MVWVCGNCGEVIPETSARLHPSIDPYVSKPDYPKFDCILGIDPPVRRHIRRIDFTEVLANMEAEMEAEVEADDEATDEEPSQKKQRSE